MPVAWAPVASGVDWPVVSLVAVWVLVLAIELVALPWVVTKRAALTILASASAPTMIGVAA